MDNSDLRVPDNWMKIWNIKIPQKNKSFLVACGKGLPSYKGNTSHYLSLMYGYVFVVRDLMKMNGIFSLVAIKWRKYRSKRGCGILLRINWK